MPSNATELHPMLYLPVLSFYVKSSFIRFLGQSEIVLAGTTWTVSIAFSVSFCSEFRSKMPLLAPLVLLTLATSAFVWTDLSLFQNG
jgi:CHASE1-domain containing sensor protein